jgi:hypothetical protein
MQAMQYSFALPADYPMATIRRRIAERGQRTDGLPGLIFKAYLWAARDESPGSAENLYAPFYLWRDNTGMNDFLAGPGFAGVTGAFGWPSVAVWSVWQASLTEQLVKAVFASRELDGIAPHTDLAALRLAETEWAQRLLAEGALAAISLFEPTGWRRLRFCLWQRQPTTPATTSGQHYRVGYLSPGAALVDAITAGCS